MLYNLKLYLLNSFTHYGGDFLIFGYARVSTNGQVHDGNSLELQINAPWEAGTIKFLGMSSVAQKIIVLNLINS